MAPPGSAARTASACGPGGSAPVCSVAPHGAHAAPSRLHSGWPVVPSVQNPTPAIGPVRAAATAAAGAARVALGPGHTTFGRDLRNGGPRIGVAGVVSGSHRELVRPLALPRPFRPGKSVGV